jgi:hypothetical protein
MGYSMNVEAALAHGSLDDDSLAGEAKEEILM